MHFFIFILQHLKLHKAALVLLDWRITTFFVKLFKKITLFLD